MSRVKRTERLEDVTLLLRQASRGDKEAFDRLLPRVYEELKRLARAKLRAERQGLTLDTTALVHEAYLKLIDQTKVEWQSRSHFFAVASQAMRRILIDYARTRKRVKRGEGAPHVSLDAADVEPSGVPLFGAEQAGELIALDEALSRLARFNRRGADVVQYRFFGGLGHREIAEVLGVSEITVRRSWTVAKSWLRRELQTEASGAPRARP